MHVALLANEASGTGCQPDDLERMLRRHGADVSAFGIGEIDAAAAARPDRIAVAGGDGSIATAAAAAGEIGAALAVIASGTANDFARGFGLPTDIEEACRLAAVGTAERTLELARMDGRPFVNVASAGLAADAAREARQWKKRIGPLAYAIGAVAAGLRVGPIEASVRADGREVFSGPAWQVIVSSSGRFGAGSSVGPADPADGRLDVTVVEARSRARLVVHAYGLRSGRIVEQRGVRHATGRDLEVDVPEETGFNVDGEILARGHSRFTVEPRAFRLVVP